MARPLFSILHPSARPEQWRKVYDDWMSKCVDPSQVEYVLCVDERWGFADSEKEIVRAAFGMGVQSVWRAQLSVVFNQGRRCYVDAVNTAAKAATGQILIVIADDQFACERWDISLFNGPCERDKSGAWTQGEAEFVLEVSTGTPQEHERGIFVAPIVSRARYERLGYLFYPEYESMYADNDLCEHARKDGVVIDARHLLFPHRHPMFENGQWTGPVELDAAYKAQNRPEAFALGERVLAWRRLAHFSKLSDEPGKTAYAQGTQKPTLVVCYPGEQFSGDWVDGFLNLLFWAAKHFVVQPLRAYTSNPYMTRMDLCSMVLAENPKPDFVLWLDDDNVATPEQLEQLVEDLREHEDVDAVAGWCWIHIQDKHIFLPSCGMWSEGGTRLTPYDGRLWLKETSVRRIDWTGFPFLLMRGGALEKAGGRNAFLPILDDSLPHGMSGEDIAWCKRATEAGLILAADPRVRVDHLKVVSAEPYIPVPADPEPNRRYEPEGWVKLFDGSTVPTHRAREPRVAAMLRVKNEGRWIKRVIEAITPLCDVGIFVFDDASTDDTKHICEQAGARVMSPFMGDGIDEARDKNYLMSVVIGSVNPDWILCIDGDEELEQGGCKKIREALRNTEMDSFTLNVPYLWNSPDTIRVDGIYRDVQRHSLFRPLPGLTFQSLYEGAKNPVHTGLHCGNVPVWVRNREKTGILDVNLWHYGYMLKEDRIRKYRWYNQIDPGNEIENFYRHVVQGDIAEVSEGEIWRSQSTGRALAGPLTLEKIPAGIGPKLDTVPHLTMACRIDCRSSEPLRLNLGCSDRLEPGFENVDMCQPCDRVVDLRGAWPWETGSVSEIRAWDIIEHLPDRIHTMNEAFRVLKPGGRLDIIVPTTDGRGAFQDPTHVSFWNRNSFFYFEAGNPHLTRFEKAYGMQCAYRVVSSDGTVKYPDGVTKLHIVLEAVEREVYANAAD
jgi:hypothetical protein